MHLKKSTVEQLIKNIVFKKMGFGIFKNVLTDNISYKDNCLRRIEVNLKDCVTFCILYIESHF